jgi:hypothetical protein
MHPSDYNFPFHGLFMSVSTQIIAFVIIDCSYLRFYIHFDRGLKVRLFGSPQWSEALSRA